MKNAIRISLNVALGLCLGVAIAACSSGGSSGTAASSATPVADRYSFMGSPTVNATKVADSTKSGGTERTAPIDKWRSPSTQGASFIFDPSAKNGAGAFMLTGDGASPAKEVFSPVIAVTPGRTYTFSAWVDASKVDSGWTYFWVSNESRNRIYMKAQISPRQAGRFAFKMQIPSGANKVIFGYYTAGCRLGKGQKIALAQPFVAADVR